jgi:DNA-binding CsgD family transcriptional regulator
MEVAELASEGLQNKEIAERLFISPETIKQHLKSITIKTRWTTRQLGLEAQARRIAQLLRATA